MSKKYVCMVYGVMDRKPSSCSSPVGAFWECPNCEAKMCHNCQAARGNNQCPLCERPVIIKRIQ